MIGQFVPTVPPTIEGKFDRDFVRWLNDNFTILFDLLKGGQNISGTFTGGAGEVITIVNGIVVEIVP